MIMEDKLNTAQRIRLEALAQSIAAGSLSLGGPIDTDEIMKRAQEFERYICARHAWQDKIR